MLCGMITAFAGARPWSRAAKFGVSPTTPRSCASPDPTRSPTTTKPVATPTRACSFAVIGSCWNRTLWVVLVCLGVAEVHQHAVAHVFRDEAVKPGDRLRDA